MNLVDRLERVFPWGVEAGIRSLVLTVGSGAGLIVTWAAVADQGVFSRQVGWLTVGVLMLIISLYSHLSLVIRGRRAVGLRRARLITDSTAELWPVIEDLLTVGVSSGVSEDTRAAGDGTVRVVRVRGLDLYHLPGCPMLEGREVSLDERAAAAPSDLSPCGICVGRTARSGSAR